MSVMKASELVKKHIDVAKNYKTVYMWGCFGSPVSEGIISEKAKKYPDWYTAAKQARYRGLIGKGYFGFDCVNLTKGILWGWNGSPRWMSLAWQTVMLRCWQSWPKGSKTAKTDTAAHFSWAAFLFLTSYTFWCIIRVH